MPLYEYQCDSCSHRFEVIQKFSDPLVEKCPRCGAKVQKLVSSPAFQFKGSGFYATDYAKKSETGKNDGKGDGKGDGKSESKSESSSSDSKDKSSSDSSTKSSSSSSGESSSKTESSSKDAPAAPTTKPN